MKLSFNMRFIDESHNGGTTELAQEILNFYGKNTFTVQITATYSKPINNYIPPPPVNYSNIHSRRSKPWPPPRRIPLPAPNQ